MSSRISRILALILCFSVSNLGFSQFASAAVVTTGDALRGVERTEQINSIQRVLVRADVQAMLQQQGVSLDHAMQRVAALSDQELQILQEQFEQLPAGGIGIFEVLGITFLVLMILELTGTINIFSKF
jgi:hypothetical protein